MMSGFLSRYLWTYEAQISSCDVFSGNSDVSRDSSNKSTLYSDCLESEERISDNAKATPGTYVPNSLNTRTRLVGLICWEGRDYFRWSLARSRSRVISGVPAHCFA